MCKQRNNIFEKVLFTIGMIGGFMFSFSIFEAADIYLESKGTNEKQDVKD